MLVCILSLWEHCFFNQIMYSFKITLSMCLLEKRKIHCEDMTYGPFLGPCCKTPRNQGQEKQRRISRVSLKRKESWYSFMYCEDRDSSRKREQTLLMSSTWTSVPCEKQPTTVKNACLLLLLLYFLAALAMIRACQHYPAFAAHQACSTDELDGVTEGSLQANTC